MSYDAKTERLISIKKLSAKAQTSNDKGLANEGLPSGITMASATVFGESIPTTSDQESDALYKILTGSGISGNGQVEYIRFPASFIAGSDTSSGRHGFELKLPSDYETNSKNPKKGIYPFLNNQSINITSGSLQLIPPSFATAYESRPFYGGSSSKDSGTRISVLDARDWYMDYFNGIFFQQDPPGTGAHAENPDYVQGYLYIGKYLAEVVSQGTPAGNNTEVQFNDGGSFAGDANFTFNKASNTLKTTNISGSLTHLSDGTSYLRAGSNVTIVSGSNGSVTISSTGGGGGSGTSYFTSPVSGYLNTTGSTAFAGGDGASYIPSSVGTDAFFFVSGTIGSKNSATRGTAVFGGDVVVSGSVYTKDGIVANRTKNVYFLASDYTTGDAVPVSSDDFSSVSYDPHLIDILLNGSTLHSGSAAQVSSSDRDYYISGASSLKFSFDLRIDDVIDVVVYSVIR